jgi:hypothetical protein
MKVACSRALAVVAIFVVASGEVAYAEQASSASDQRFHDDAFGGPSRGDANRIKVAQNCDYSEDSFDTVWLGGRVGNNFDPAIGCHVHANLEAMVSKRSDLTAGRGTRYSDGERAANIIGRYRKSEPKQVKAGAEGTKTITAPAAPNPNDQ